MILHLREKKETGFSLLELSVAVGVSAIVATAGIVATTAFIGSAQDKRDSYTSNANSAIENAEASSLALGASGLVEDEIVPSTDKAATTTILASTGETVLGTDVTVSASGLKPGAAYTIVLQSDPVTLASGTVGATGLLSETVTIPADTPSGWHSITLTSTYYDDTALSNVQWLEIAGDGTLAGTSDTEPPVVLSLSTPFTLSYGGANNDEMNIGLNGVSGWFFDEARTSWDDMNQVLSVALSVDGTVSQGGWYMWEQASADPSNFYGTWNASGYAYNNNILVAYNENGDVQSFHVYFTTAGGAGQLNSPAYNANWAQYEVPTVFDLTAAGWTQEYVNAPETGQVYIQINAIPNELDGVFQDYVFEGADVTVEYDDGSKLVDSVSETGSYGMDNRFFTIRIHVGNASSWDPFVGGDKKATTITVN